MKKFFTLAIMAMLAAGSAFAGKTVAFLYEPGYNSGKASSYGLAEGGYTLDQDPVYAALCAEFDVTPVAIDKNAEADYELLQTYDCVVFSEAMSGNSTCTNNLVKLVGTVPIVSMKTYNYTSGRWSWAAPSNPGTKTSSIMPAAGFESHDLFSGLERNDDGSISLYDENTTASSNRMQGFAATAIIEGSLLADETDKLYATASGTDYVSVHEIANAGESKYVLVGMSSDNIWAVNANGQKIIVNAVNYVLGEGNFNMNEDINIAYLYDSSYGTYKCGIDNDPFVVNTVLAERNTVCIDVKDFTADDTEMLDSLSKFDLVVIGEAIGGTHKFGVKLVELVNRVPILNFKSFFYADKRWNVGAGVNPVKVGSGAFGIPDIKVNEAYLEDELFADVEMEDDGTIHMFVNVELENNLVQSYTANADGLFGSDDVIATVNDLPAIHRHGNKNTYMLIPLSSDAVYVEEECNLSDAAIQLINNAVRILAETKGNVTPCVTPTASFAYGNRVTTVTLASSTTGATIYYTLDGSEPSATSGTKYEAPFEITENCTVKAIAVKQGNDDSSVATFEAIVQVVAAAPQISIERQAGQSLVTISTSEEGATVYYGFVEAATTSNSVAYEEPVAITQPVTIYAFAAGEGFLSSEIVSAFVGVDGVDATTIRLDTLTHFDANSGDWYWETEGGNSKVAYYMGKSSMSKYESIDTIVSGTDTTYNYHLREPLVFYAKNSATNEFDNGWKVKTMGQLVQWESTAPQKVVGKAGDAAYNCDKVSDLVDGGATNGHITLTNRHSGEDYNASIETTKKYQGPFDVVVYVGNNNSDGAALTLAIQVSADGETWESVDTVGVSYYKRFWTKQQTSYEGTDEVFVRVKQAGGGTKLAVYDILLKNNGELSKAYTEDGSGVVPAVNDASLVGTEVYGVNGIRLAVPSKGVNIVRRVYSDGTVTVQKVFVR